MKRLCTLALGAAALAALQGCSDEPGLYLGGPAGPPAAIQVSDSRVDLEAGGSTTIGLRVVDAAGNTVESVAPTVSSGNGAIATVAVGGASGQWTATATINGLTLGEAALAVSAGSLTAEVVARVGPATYTLLGPASMVSGQTADYEAKLWDLAGNELTLPGGFPPPTLASTQTGRVSLTRTGPLTWTATAAAAGPSDVLLATDTKAASYGPYVGARRTLTVVPDVFVGTLSVSSAAPGELVTATKAASGPVFDADSKVTLGATAAFVDGFTANTLRFAVPAIGSTAAATLTLFDMGPLQLAHATTFTATKATTDVYQPGNVTNDCSDPAAAPDVSAVMSPTGWIYFNHNGTALGTRGCQNSGAVTGYDHYFIYTTGASDEVMDVEARWTLTGDNDIIICATDYSDCPGVGFSGGTLAELDAVDVPLLANTSYFIIYSPWTGNAGTNQIRIKITAQ
jgi:hypothetical protein